MPTRFQIDKGSATPVYVQLEEQIRLLIHRGALVPGDAMPTVRALAVQLGVNANTVARVYRQLQQQGLLRLERGLGTFVDQPTAKTVDPRDWERIAQQVETLVEHCQQAGLTTRELTQLVEATWKEKQQGGS